jgi:hypothetical protein
VGNSEGDFLKLNIAQKRLLDLCKTTKIKKFPDQGSILPSPSGNK